MDDLETESENEEESLDVIESQHGAAEAPLVDKASDDSYIASEESSDFNLDVVVGQEGDLRGYAGRNSSQDRQKDVVHQLMLQIYAQANELALKIEEHQQKMIPHMGKKDETEESMMDVTIEQQQSRREFQITKTNLMLS